MLKFIGVVRQDSSQNRIVLLSILLLPDVSGNLCDIVVVEVGYGKESSGQPFIQHLWFFITF